MSAGDLPNKTMSSAKITVEMLTDPREIPRPVEFNSEPRLFMNRANRRGLKLQPEMSKM